MAIVTLKNHETGENVRINTRELLMCGSAKDDPATLMLMVTTNNKLSSVRIPLESNKAMRKAVAEITIVSTMERLDLDFDTSLDPIAAFAEVAAYSAMAHEAGHHRHIGRLPSEIDKYEDGQLGLIAASYLVPADTMTQGQQGPPAFLKDTLAKMSDITYDIGEEPPTAIARAATGAAIALTELMRQIRASSREGGLLPAELSALISAVTRTHGVKSDEEPAPKPKAPPSATTGHGPLECAQCSVRECPDRKYPYMAVEARSLN